MFENFKNKKINKEILNKNIGNVSLKHILYIFLFLFLFYFIMWVVIAKKMSWTIIGQIDSMREQKINIAFDNYRNTGFPFSFATKINNVVYRNNFKSFMWKTKELLVKSALTNTNKIITHIPQDNFFFRIDTNHPNKKEDTYLYKIGLRSDNTRIELSYLNKNLQNIYLTSSNGILQTSGSSDAFRYRLFEFGIKESQVIIEDDITDILEMNFYTHNIEPPQFWKTILKDNFISLTGKVYLMNPSYFHEFNNFYKFILRNYDPPEIMIDNITLKHALSTVKISGLLRFDSDMKLSGDMVLTINHYKKLLHFLTKKGVIAPKAASNFRFMLSFLQTTQTIEKANQSVDIDLTLKKNILYHGKIKLFELKV